MDSPAKPPSIPYRPGRFLLALGVLLAIVIAQKLFFPVEKPAGELRSGSTGQTIALTIDRGVGEPPAIATIAWRTGLTVLGALQASSAAQPLEVVGAGENAFVSASAGRTNEGAEGLNWQFELNGEYGQASAGATKLQPNDRVLWKFAPFQ